MASWKNLVIVCSLVASALALPRPDEYQIPKVGNNRRSQYYVLHDDGSFKYGFDTGEDAFESQKTSDDGEVDGKFGYRDPDGQDVRVEYTSGSGGFVAQGSHIPQVHPDVAAAFEAARNAPPFVDPLADSDGDRSYNFDFDGDEHSRNEISDSDGTVRGSYSYVDEFGRTRSYTYRAGKGIGFVIEGDDIPQPVQPLPTHRTSTQFGASHTSTSTASRRKPQRTAASSVRGTSSQSSRGTHFGASSSAHSGNRRQPAKPAQTYFPPTPTGHSAASTRTGTHSSTSTRTGVHSSASTRRAGSAAGSHSQSTFAASRPTVTRTHTQSSTFGAARPASTRQSTRTSSQTRNFEAANTRASQSPSGSYSLAYETSSHSRQESGDDDNNVRGNFRFVADDDGVDRSVSYEASSSTGFIAQGEHLPIGPVVPGAPTGQVTGRIVQVEEIPFIDPLADSGLDASYNFRFDGDEYSRSEVADEDGNVSGTYSILGEDNILRTYRFRAGKGIGFETEEISAVPGRSGAGSRVSSGSTQRGSASSSINRGSAQSGTFNQQTSFSSHQTGTTSGHAGSSSRRVVKPIATTYTAPRAQSSRASSHSTGHTSSFASSGSSHRSGSSASTRTTSGASRQSSFNPNFSLRQYDATEGRGKYGYVLRFDD